MEARINSSEDRKRIFEFASNQKQLQMFWSLLGKSNPLLTRFIKTCVLSKTRNFDSIINRCIIPVLMGIKVPLVEEKHLLTFRAKMRRDEDCAMNYLDKLRDDNPDFVILVQYAALKFSADSALNWDIYNLLAQIVFLLEICEN
jgi:hypothetical protein